MLGPGNPANSAIGRAYQLMAINLGGAYPGINRMSSIGSPVNRGGMCFAEYADGLPPGWKGLNEEFGYGKDENVSWSWAPRAAWTGPSSHRAATGPFRSAATAA